MKAAEEQARLAARVKFAGSVAEVISASQQPLPSNALMLMWPLGSLFAVAFPFGKRPMFVSETPALTQS